MFVLKLSGIKSPLIPTYLRLQIFVVWGWAFSLKCIFIEIAISEFNLHLYIR